MHPLVTTKPGESTVSKVIIGCLLALSVAVFISGCGKEPAAPAAPAAAPEAPPATMPAPAPHPTPAAPIDTVDLSGIEKAEGGKTIAEVFAEKDQLAGETIVFRGKVVKTNAGIMGKNWLHIRDGSGAEGTNNLTVTTVEVLPNVGDTVLVSGAVQLNKDFGMGYQYDIIIEDADVTVETAASE
jgi:hypothetical protein